jgi:hypothetical protein
LNENLMREAHWVPMALKEPAGHSLMAHRMALSPGPRTPRMVSAR